MWLACPGGASVSRSARAYPSTEMRCATGTTSRSIERSGGLDAPCAQGHPTSIAPLSPRRTRNRNVGSPPLFQPMSPGWRQLSHRPVRCPPRERETTMTLAPPRQNTPLLPLVAAALLLACSPAATDKGATPPPATGGSGGSPATGGSGG